MPRTDGERSESHVVDPTMDPRVSRFDRVSAMLTASIVLSSSCAVVLFLLWLTQSNVSRRHVAASRPLVELPQRESSPGQLDFEEVGGDELPDVAGTQFSEALASLTQAVAHIDGQGLFEGGGTHPEFGHRD